MPARKTKLGQVTAILGSQWGDEGKGKLVDILSEKFDIVARATGGANAGHTIYLNDPENPGKKKKFVFHLIPSGILNQNCVCVIGNGVALHLETMLKELELLKENKVNTLNRILISDRAHLLFEYHKEIDGIEEEMKGAKKVGTTKRGIGPCYTDKVRRNGIRVHDLFNFEVLEEKYRSNLKIFRKMYGKIDYDVEKELENLKEIAKKIKPMVIDTAYFLDKALKSGQKILLEGANGTLLDIDHGTYPFVTSSNATIGGVLSGTGIGATKLTDAIGIMKAYTTRVGGGPFPTELKDKLGDEIRESGGEYGATTGRPRRCGWFDAVVGKYAVIVNGLTEINLTKLDVLTGLDNLKIAISYKYKGEYIKGFPADTDLIDDFKVEYIELPGWKKDISKVKKFEDLPKAAQKYVQTIEKLIECPISSIGVGVERNDMIFR